MIHDMSWESLAFTLVNIIIYAGIAQGFFLSLILTTRKNRKRGSNRILAILLTVISISILHSVLFLPDFHTPYVIREPFVLLIGPLLLFYARGVFGITPFRRVDLIHFIPLILFFAVPITEKILGPSSDYSHAVYEYSVPLSIGVWIFIVAQFGFYWWRIVRLLHANLSAVEDEFSSLEGKTLSWMKTFLHTFGILFIILAFTVVLAVHTTHYAAVDSIVSFGLSCIVFVLGYEGLFQEEVFLALRGGLNGRTPKSRQLQKVGEANELDETLSQQVVDLFASSKPYLDEGLTLTKLADQLNTSRNQLSSVINAKFGSNFYMFVNKYRVEEVKRLIADPGNRNYTLLSLAYQAGFPSKSSFQEIFKKFTGMTPSEYQKAIEV